MSKGRFLQKENRFNTAVIFFTGSVILSLELISSRIMTPYFGVSLYIWAGILSITLVALAIGYYLGGRLSDVEEKSALSEGYLEYMFLLMPALSALSMGVACILYPKVFLSLAQAGLVPGAFLAALVLLFIPLVAMASMNPLLVAMGSSDKVHGSKDHPDHAGLRAGYVFFVSTAGSVAGVIATAFIFIPNSTNFNSVLSLGVALTILSLVAGARSRTLSREKRIKVIGLSLLGLALCGGLLVFSSAYLNKKGQVSFKGSEWKIEKEYTSVFGNTKVISLDGRLRALSQDGFIQGVTDDRGRSFETFTYVMEAIATGARPGARNALVLGLGTGTIPMRLSRGGIEVEVVEINPNALEAARDFFNFDESSVTVNLMDARAFVKGCPMGYDLILVDLFHGDGIPDYLITKEFFHDIKGCLSPGGLAVFNTFADPRFIKDYYHIIKTLKSVFSSVVMYHDVPRRHRG
jgi:spermidine synthase